MDLAALTYSIAKKASIVEKLKAGQAEPLVRICTDSFEKSKDDDAPRTLRIRASTKSRDRDNDTIDPAGWQLENYKRNPTFLWAHESREFPIGKALETWVDPDALRQITQHPTAEEYAKADTFFRLAKGGYVNTVSVGFMPLKWLLNEERGPLAMDFLEQELLEVSAVPIPSNPQALIEARSKLIGLDLSPVLEWCVRTLDAAGQDDVLRPLTESAYRLLSGKSVGILVRGVDLKLAPPTDLEELARRLVPAKAAEVVPETKRGRVLSAANEGTLRDAVGDITTAAERISSVLAQVDAAGEEAAPDGEAKGTDDDTDSLPPACEGCDGHGEDAEGETCKACDGTGTEFRGFFEGGTDDVVDDEVAELDLDDLFDDLKNLDLAKDDGTDEDAILDAAGVTKEELDRVIGDAVRGFKIPA